jgi:hypothetical protein
MCILIYYSLSCDTFPWSYFSVFCLFLRAIYILQLLSLSLAVYMVNILSEVVDCFVVLTRKSADFILDTVYLWSQVLSLTSNIHN